MTWSGSRIEVIIWEGVGTLTYFECLNKLKKKTRKTSVWVDVLPPALELSSSRQMNGGNYIVTMKHYCVLRYQWLPICGKEHTFCNNAKIQSFFHEEFKSTIIL